jgi:hypothetical protein
VTWTRPGLDADKFHFFGEVKQITMIGTIRQGAPPRSKRKMVSLASYRYIFEHRKADVSTVSVRCSPFFNALQPGR